MGTSAQRGPAVESFGARLKRERERQGMKLDDVAIATKVGIRMLQALEEEAFSQLPGGVFNKGFVRAYARHLGLNEEQAVTDYLKASGGAEPARKPEELVAEIAAQAEMSRGRKRASGGLPWGWLAVALLFIAFCLGLWGARKGHSSREDSRPRQTAFRVCAPLRPRVSSAVSQFHPGVRKPV